MCFRFYKLVLVGLLRFLEKITDQEYIQIFETQFYDLREEIRKDKRLALASEILEMTKISRQKVSKGRILQVVSDDP